MSSRTFSRHARAWLITCAAVTFGSVLVSCSVGAEDQSHTWSGWKGYDDLVQNAPAGLERIYFLGTAIGVDNVEVPTLMPVKRKLQAAQTPYEAILNLLLAGPTAQEVTTGLRTGLPSGLRVLDVTIDQGVARVDVSKEITSTIGADLSYAIAQIVFTLCERSEVRQVSVLVDGQSIDWPRPDGIRIDRPLTPFDFPDLAKTSQPDFPLILR